MGFVTVSVQVKNSSSVVKVCVRILNEKPENMISEYYIFLMIIAG